MAEENQTLQELLKIRTRNKSISCKRWERSRGRCSSSSSRDWRPRAELEPLSPGECKARCALVKKFFSLLEYFLRRIIYGFRISLKQLSLICELGFFRKCRVPNLSGQRDNEHPGSLGCVMELGTVFAFASDSSMRKISPIAGWASKCLLRKNKLLICGKCPV